MAGLLIVIPASSDESSVLAVVSAGVGVAADGAIVGVGVAVEVGSGVGHATTGSSEASGNVMYEYQAPLSPAAGSVVQVTNILLP